MAVEIDPTADPMRIDFRFRSGGKDCVSPCIFRFETCNLVIVHPTAPEGVHWRADGDYPSRPKSFTCTKQNKYRKETLAPCQLYDQD